MRTTYVILLTAFAAGLAAASPMLAETHSGEKARAPLPAGGSLGTLPAGRYQCALPGDAASKAFKVVADEEFRIGAASRYSNAEGTGSYVLRGTELIFTRGPKKGERYERVGENQLRKLDGQTETKLLCTRIGGGA